MKLLVDTSIWSIALRRKKLAAREKMLVDELKELIKNLQVVLIGPVRQELLSGIVDNKHYEKLKKRLSFIEDLPIYTEDYERAALFFNICRAKGIQGSHIDFLICSVAANHKLPIFTLDKDFIIYADYLPISIYHGKKE
jgi:predicted nucleic acid-binding protein